MKLESNSAAGAFFLPWIQLVKVPLCLLVAVSAGFGAILHTPMLTPALGGVMGGVFFLACGAAGFNSLQERAVDRLFVRTRNRPLVTGRLTGCEAAWFSSLLVTLGLLALFLSAKGWQPLVLGIAALGLYNGVYTPLKATSIFALFPGALAGAMPPLIGWTTNGGWLGDRPAWMLFSLFFLWQIPHFCLILLRYQEDYHAVDRPALIRLFPEQSLKRIIVVWILALNVAALSLALHRDLLVPGSRLIIGLMTAVTTPLCVPLFLRNQGLNYRLLFVGLNSCFFFTLLTVTVVQVISSFGR